MIAEEEESPEILLYLRWFWSCSKECPYPNLGLIEGGVKPAKWGHSINIELGN